MTAAALHEPGTAGHPAVRDPAAGEPGHAEPAGGRAGRRRARQAARRVRRRRLGLQLAGTITASALVGAAGAWALNGAGAQDHPVEDAAVTAAAPADAQDTLLLVRTAPDGEAGGVTLLAADDRGASVLFLPTGTLVDIPGFGLERLASAQEFAGAEAVEASVENALGIAVDHVAAVSDEGFGAFLDRAGGVAVDVEERLVQRAADGSAQVRFEAGEQVLDGPRLAELAAFRARGEDELAAFPRQQAVWSSLLAAAGEQGMLDRLLADGAPQLRTDADPAFVRGVLERLAGASAAGDLAFALLPVQPFGGTEELSLDTGGGTGQETDTYRLAAEEAAEVVQRLLARSIPDGGGAQALRVQVLNGVGRPGIGQQVDRRLEGAGVRIELSNNARSFDFPDTRILVYDEQPATLAAAERVRQRLGVGTIQVSRQPQSVVDLTIVVGADFLTAAEPAAPAQEGRAQPPTPET